MNKNEIKINLIKKIKLNKFPPKKIIENNILINKILAYSAKKIKANPPLEYSTLNPETNSDSPSEKSNGVRLVSANIEIKKIKDKGNLKNKNQTLICFSKNKYKLNPPNKKI